MSTLATTRKAADDGDTELAPELQRACIVFRNTGDVTRVDLCGFTLQRTDLNTWKVWARHDGDDATSDLVDEIDPRQFRSAQALREYVRAYERADAPTTSGDSTDEDDDSDDDREYGGIGGTDAHRVI